MSGPSDFQPTNPALKWIERRLPIMGLVHSSFVAYPTPRNLNYWWTFGAILSMMLGLQILTGVILAMHYTPHADLAFKSIESIVRDVNYGWLLRNMHASGASMFFVAVYVHMFRGLYYGSYKEPREILCPCEAPMAFSIRPYRRFPVQCAVSYDPRPFLKLPLAYLLGFWLLTHSCF